MTTSITTKDGQAVQFKALGFPGGERHVELSSNSDHTEFVFISARLKNSNDLMDLMLVVNALKHRFGSELAIDLELPYLPYSRQDRVCSEGQAFSLEVMVQIIKAMGVRRLITWDCHSSVGVDLTGAENISPVDVIRSNQNLVSLLQADETVLVCPDKGARNRCKEIKEAIGVPTMVSCTKQRDPDTGKITRTEVDTESLEGKTAVITDDICDGGYTFLKVAEQLKAKGVEKIVLYVTHGIFSKGLEVFDGLIDQIYTTNSFEHEACEKLIELNYTYQGE